MNENLKEQASQVIALLVAGKYNELETLTHGVRLAANEIAAAVAKNGYTMGEAKRGEHLQLAILNGFIQSFR